MKHKLPLGAALAALWMATPALAQDVPPVKTPDKTPIEQPAKKQDKKANQITVWVMEAKGKG